MIDHQVTIIALNANSTVHRKRDGTKNGDKWRGGVED